MDLLYPKLNRESVFFVLRSALIGVLIGGVYGMLHDQVSYSIAPEYFTKMKFQQFAYANFGWPPRAFAAEVGFLASWWVGMIAGWILGRIAVRHAPVTLATSQMLKGFGILIATAACCGLIGIALGFYFTRGDGIADWNEWRDELRLEHTREFAIVAYLHAASYLGAVLGLIAALLFLRRSRKST